jgi:putative methylase
MAQIGSKSKLAVVLSKLKGFDKPKVKEEQYMTDSEIAADILWNAFMDGYIGDKTIADLGSGTGILGIGALLLGAKKVFFVEHDPEVMAVSKENYQNIVEKLGKQGEAVFVPSDVKKFKTKVDVVIENPPFGTKGKHADRDFLVEAMNIAPVIYSIHKKTSKMFLEAFSADNSFYVSKYKDYDMPLKATMAFHKKRIQRIKVGMWKLKKA